MPTPRQIKPPGPPSPQASRPTGDPVVGAASSRPGPGAMCSEPQWFPWLVTGGHKALPYGPACDSAVGAGFIPRLGPGAMCSGPRWFPWLVTGGHKALPYGPACDSAVGAGFIPARDQVRCVPSPGGSRGWSRAAASRPYGARLTWSVGRGAHTPPNQAAGTAKPTSIAPHRRSCRRGGLCERLEPGPGRRKTAARSRRRGILYGQPQGWCRAYSASSIRP